MPFFSRKKHPFNPPPANGLCTWSAHEVLQSEWSPGASLFPRCDHTLTATATAAGEFFLFGGFIGHVHRCASSNLYVFSTQDFSTTLLQTSGDVPTPRATQGAALIDTTLLIWGGTTNFGDEYVLNHDSLYLLNLGTSDLLMSSPTSADYSFALQNRESGPALWSMVLDPMVVHTIPQPWWVPSSLCSVVRLGLTGRPSMTCGHLI